MAVNIADVKLYLRIDGTAEDELLLRLAKSAESSVRTAVDNYDTLIAADENYKSQAEQIELYMIADLYENRLPNKDIGDYSYTIRSMLAQLRYWPWPTTVAAEGA